LHVLSAPLRRPSSDALAVPPAPVFSPLFTTALSASIVLHAVVLSVRFGLPDPTRFRMPPQTIDVVLVNSKSATKPAKPDVIAQANLDGGGNTDENRRAKTPLPVTREVERGDDVKRARKRVEDLEAKQRQLLTKLAKSQATVPVQEPKPAPAETPPAPVSGADLMSSALALARMEAQIARQVDEYNKRPRKQFVGARAAESRFALYVEGWRQKIERIGNLNYPEDARGRIYGSLRVTVSIKPDGSVEEVQIDRPSEYKILNEAALKIVRMGAPYAPFPAEIKRDTDLLVITRTWTFAPGDRLYNE
jgi:protein TonB